MSMISKYLSMGTELSGLDNISPFSKCRTVGRHAGDHHGSPFPNKVLCVDTSKHIYLHETLTVNSFLLNRYSSLTVFISQDLNISACSHRTSIILTYFESTFHAEFTGHQMENFYHTKSVSPKLVLRFLNNILTKS